jgi:PiT family inorganic phosphate transporter
VSSDVVLALVVVTALAFDFTNGFHDTGNAMATSIATGALPPRIAVAMSGVLNLVGAGSYALAHAIGGTAGVIVDLVILIAVSGTIYWRSRGKRVGHDNVNAEWTGSVTPEPVPA